MTAPTRRVAKGVTAVRAAPRSSAAGSVEVLHTLDELAELWRVSRDSVEEMINRGDLTAVDVRGSGSRPRLRVPSSEVARFVAARTLPAVNGPRVRAVKR